MTELRELLAWAREDERERIALDLHDGVAPLVAGARMQVEALLARPGAHDAEALRALTGLLAECGAELRRAVQELCPPDLADGGLVAALERHVALLGLDCRVTAVGAPARLPPWRELAAFRFAQEALANATRHAGDRPLELRIAFEPGVATVSVADGGPGVATASIADGGPGARRRGSGLGRRSMRRNALRAQGALELTSSAHAGTTVALRLPR